jgi:hypothetical protein
MAINYPITPDIIMNVSLMLNAINAIKDNWSNSRHYYEHLINVKFNESSEKWLINVTDTYFPGELERECENYLIREMSPEKSVEKKTNLNFKKWNVFIGHDDWSIFTKEPANELKNN